MSGPIRPAAAGRADQALHRPGTRVRLPSGATGYVSVRLAGGLLGVICDHGYVPVPADQVVELGPDPVHWDRHEHLRQYNR